MGDWWGRRLRQARQESSACEDLRKGQLELGQLREEIAEVFCYLFSWRKRIEKSSTPQMSDQATLVDAVLVLLAMVAVANEDRVVESGANAKVHR